MGGKNGDICRLRASADRQATIPKIGLPPTNQLGRTSSKKCSAGALCSAWQWLCWQSPKLVSPCNAPQVCVAEEVNITRSHVVSAHHILCHSTLAHEPWLPSWPSGVKSLTTHQGMLPWHLLLLSPPSPSAPSPSTSPSTGRENPWSPAVQPSEHPVTFPASH